MTTLHLHEGGPVSESRERGAFEKFLSQWPTWGVLALSGLFYANTIWNKQAVNDEHIRQMNLKVDRLTDQVNDLRGDVRELTTKINYLNASPALSRGR
jgi:hypothetical protein